MGGLRKPPVEVTIKSLKKPISSGSKIRLDWGQWQSVVVNQGIEYCFYEPIYCTTY